MSELCECVCMVSCTDWCPIQCEFLHIASRDTKICHNPSQEKKTRPENKQLDVMLHCYVELVKYPEF